MSRVVKAASDAKSGQRRQQVTRRVLLAVAAALLGIAAFVIGTPFTLLTLSKIRPTDWLQLGNVGQAYGGAAAVLGMLALAGAAATVVLQARQTAISRHSSERAVHTDLLFKALDDPDLLACWGPLSEENHKLDRQIVYCNLIVSFWQSEFDLGDLSEDGLRDSAATMFKAAPGRRYWSLAGPHQRSIYQEAKDVEFLDILDEEYMKVKSVLDAESTKNDQSLVPLIHNQSVARTAALSLACAAAVASALIGARKTMRDMRNSPQQ